LKSQAIEQRTGWTHGIGKNKGPVWSVFLGCRWILELVRKTWFHWGPRPAARFPEAPSSHVTPSQVQQSVFACQDERFVCKGNDSGRGNEPGKKGELYCPWKEGKAKGQKWKGKKWKLASRRSRASLWSWWHRHSPRPLVVRMMMKMTRR
jgi:hypothetical protein